MKKKKVVVIGGGASGIFAALFASKEAEVTILEKNDKLGKKLYITGKGRCNITNASDISEFFVNINSNSDFLYSALYSFTNEDTRNLIESLHVPLKVERGGRVFPNSDKSSDIINALEHELINKGVKIIFNSGVSDIVIEDNKIKEVILNDGTSLKGDSYIIATGGVSYKGTGSNGDGYKFARKCGHKIVTPHGSLVPLETSEPWISELQGLSLKNSGFKIIKDGKILYKDFGELLFTHFGVSGPVVLSGSRFVKNDGNYKIEIDFKPALTEEELDLRLQRDFSKYSNKAFKNSLSDLLPQKLIPVMIKLSSIDEDKKVHSITKDERKKLLSLLKHFILNLKGQRPIDEAIITSGGVNTKEIDPGTMRSKLVPNLYFAGEVIDVDANTGGYNLQIAISTAFLAGSSASKEK